VDLLLLMLILTPVLLLTPTLIPSLETDYM
jgi:hypothetical protein